MAQHAGTKQLGLNFTVNSDPEYEYHDHKDEGFGLANHPQSSGLPSLCVVQLKYLSYVFRINDFRLLSDTLFT
jgi:hypothetical protein